MSRCPQAVRPLALCLRPRRPAQLNAPSTSTATARFFSPSPSHRDVEPTSSAPPPSAADAQAVADLVHASPEPNANISTEAETAEKTAKRELRERWMDPNTTTLAWAERKLLKAGIDPVGSRRRRAAVRQTPNIPFEQLPFHCYQEARQLLAADRAQKLGKIVKAYQTLKKVEARPPKPGQEAQKNRTVLSMHVHLENLKVQADMNDPAVKRKFEDGFGDMNKPIYRYLARERWLKMAYKILVQRVEQFYIVPDLLPRFNPKMDVQLAWHRFRVDPGELVNSLVSETPPNLRVQVFDSRERLVSIVVIDSDVPNAEDDAFDSRLHFMAANIPLDCLTKNISLNLLASKQSDKIAVPWLPPFSQEGAPYHRLSVWILEQKDNEHLEVQRLQELYANRRDGFQLRDFRALHDVKPFGFNMFRSEWDPNTAAVMARHGIPGIEVLFRNKRIYSLKPPKKARGWEAKRQGPKYRSLWKYTKNIAKGRPGAT